MLALEIIRFLILIILLIMGLFFLYKWIKKDLKLDHVNFDYLNSKFSSLLPRNPP